MNFCTDGLRLDLAGHRRAPVPRQAEGQPLHSVQHRLFFNPAGRLAQEGEGGTFQQLVSCTHTSKMTASLCDRRHAGISPKICQGPVAGGA